MSGALVFALILVGCSTPPSPEPLSAKATVQTYYWAVNAHNWKQAKALLSPAQQLAFTDGIDSDRNNTLTVTNLKIMVYSPAPFDQNAYPGYSNVQQATASFDATYKKVITSPNGPQFQFVYVGRIGPSSPWRILSFGSGP
jgi:hypothetical protein